MLNNMPSPFLFAALLALRYPIVPRFYADLSAEPAIPEPADDGHKHNVAVDKSLSELVAGLSHPPDDGGDPDTQTVQRVKQSQKVDVEIASTRKALDRWGRVVRWLLTFCFLFSLLYVAAWVRYIARRTPDTQPPIVFSAESYTPYRELLCPWDTLMYDSHATIRRAPVRPIISESLRYKNRTLWSRDISEPPFLPQDIGLVLSTTIMVTLTKEMNLQPGPYQYRRFVEERSGDSIPQFYTVNFTIVNCHQVAR